MIKIQSYNEFSTCRHLSIDITDDLQSDPKQYNDLFIKKWILSVIPV